jgi:hypothetical protein
VGFEVEVRTVDGTVTALGPAKRGITLTRVVGHPGDPGSDQRHTLTGGIRPRLRALSPA